MKRTTHKKIKNVAIVVSLVAFVAVGYTVYEKARISPRQKPTTPVLRVIGEPLTPEEKKDILKDLFPQEDKKEFSPQAKKELLKSLLPPGVK